MKNVKQVILKTLLAASLAMTSQLSLATLISVEVADQPYQAGDIVTADIVISEIEQDSGANQIALGAFSLDFLFDSNLIENTQVTFGNSLDFGTGLFPADFGQSVNDSGNSLLISEISSEDPFVLFTEQQVLSSFVLASVQFELKGEGTVDLTLGNVSLFSAAAIFGTFTPSSIDLRGASFTVGSTQVPVPASAGLMLLPLLFLVRKRKQL